MDVNITLALISGVGVILSAWIGFLGTKKGTLASAEKEFRTTLLEENEKLRERVEDLETALTEMTKKYNKMEILLIRSGIDPAPEDPENQIVTE